MICGYARVSTKLQEREGNSLEAQEQQLKAAGANNENRTERNIWKIIIKIKSTV